MKFGDLHKIKPGSGLVVSPRHDRWLAENSNPRYSTEALDFGRSQLDAIGKPRDRRGTISASSLEGCRRKQQFTFLGLPELPPSTRLAQVFQNGSFMHVRWQMAGLTEGWLRAAEVPVGENSLFLSGTQDGVAYDDTVVELKSINTMGFTRTNTFGALDGHKTQVGTYMLCTGAEKGSIVYEDKNTQEYKEFVYTRKDLPLQEIADRADQVWHAIWNEQLFEPLDACEAGEGTRYLGCPFRKDCLKIKNWEEAKAVADQAQ